MTSIIFWNIARRDEAWRHLLSSGADVALLQEASEPPVDVAPQVEVDPAPWFTAGANLNRPWRPAVVRLSPRVEVEWFEAKDISEAGPEELAVSRLGSLAAAKVTPATGEPFIVISMYGSWENPHQSTGSSWIYADGSVHRLISDLSTFIGRQSGHRIIAAGDLNVLHGYGENGSPYWAARYATVFGRMEALGLTFVGPQAPAGRQARPWPEELPESNRNVPSFHTAHQTPTTATRQLDFVFASTGMADRVAAEALNEPEDWGPSDNCRVRIDIK